MTLEACEPLQNFLDMGEAGFNLRKRRKCGRNSIGHKATVAVPGQLGVLVRDILGKCQFLFLQHHHNGLRPTIGCHWSFLHPNPRYGSFLCQLDCGPSL